MKADWSILEMRPWNKNNTTQLHCNITFVKMNVNFDLFHSIYVVSCILMMVMKAI